MNGASSTDLYASVKRAPGSHVIASHLRKAHGMDVEVVDFVQNWTVQQLKDYFQAQVRPDTVFIGVSATFTVDYANLIEFLEWCQISYKHIPIVAGTQAYYNAAMVPVDWLIVGYGELAISALVRHLTMIGSDLKYEVHGSYNYIDATHNYDSSRLADFTITYEERDFIQPQETLTMELGRGCIFNCHFCTLVHRNIKGDHSRHEDNFRAELVDNYEKWGVTRYTLADETINDYSEKLHRYTKVINTLPFRPYFSGYMRGDLLTSRKEDWNMIDDMGLHGHFYGIESFHQPAGRAVGKGMESGKLQDGLLEYREFQSNQGFYRGHINLIAGLPGETLETLREGRDWMHTNWFPHEAGQINPLWIPSGAKRKYDEINRFSEDPAKYGYTKTTIKESNPNNDPWIPGQYPIFGGLYDIMIKQDNMERISEKAGGLDGMTFMNWQNKDTNMYEMMKYCELEFNTGEALNQAPSIFNFHKYLIDPKNTLEDMKGRIRDLDEPHEFALNFINEYIAKKFEYLS